MRHSGLVGASRKLVLKRFSSSNVVVLLFFMDFVCVFAVVLRVRALPSTTTLRWNIAKCCFEQKYSGILAV
jgi:hypothetical protein